MLMEEGETKSLDFFSVDGQQNEIVISGQKES